MALEFNLLARDNASRAFRNVGDEAERTGKRASGGLKAIGTAASAAAGALVGAGIAKGFSELYKAADESRKIAARTENVIASMGNAAGVSAKQVGDLAASIAAKTGVDDEAIQSGQNLLLTFGNIKDAAGEGNDIFTQTSELMVDLSAAMGTDASGAAIQLGKALNDPVKGITALTRVGVSFTEQQKQQIRTLTEAGDVLGAQKIILGELEKQFGGAAEAMATPLDKLRVNAGNLAEELGGYLLPVVDEIATSFNEGLLPSADQLGPKLADLAREGAELVPQLIDMAEQGLDLAVEVLPMLTGGLGLVLDIAEKLGPALPYVVAGFAAMKVAGTVGAGIEGMAGSMGRADGKLAGLGRGLGAASVALPIIGAGVGVLTAELNHDEEALANNTATMGKWITGMNQGGAAAAQARGEMAETKRVFDQVFNLDVEQTDQWKQAFGDASDASREYWESLNPVEQATQKVTEWTNNLSYALEQNGEGSEEARAAQERLAYWTDIQTSRQGALDSAVATATGTTDTYTAGLEAASEAASDASRETNMLKTALDVLTGAQVSMIEVESNYQSALADATDALKEQNGTVLDSAGKLNLQSEAGRATADVLLGVRDSGNQLIATMVQQGRTSDEVGAAEKRLRDDFIRTAGQMGITGVQAETLADQILGIPDRRHTTITAPTDQPVREIQFLQREIDGLHGKTVTVSVVHDRRALAVYAAANGMQTVGGYADGGWTGPGSKYTPAGIVHADEFVFTKEQTRRLGVNQLEMLANGAAALVPGYADGGVVVRGDSSNLRAGLQAMTQMLANSLVKVAAPGPAGPVGTGAIGGGWQNLFNAVKAAIPQARVNSAYRPGDPGAHGRGKAVDFGFGSGPGGAGSAGLASINRFLHDRFGGSLYELIYDGIGDDRPDLKRGRPLNYDAGTRAAHRNHVHAAVYENGTNYVPQTGYAMVHKGEAIVPASENQGAPFSSGDTHIHINGTFDLASSRDLRRAAETIRRELVSLEREQR